MDAHDKAKQQGNDGAAGDLTMIACALCGRPVEWHASYVVRIDVFAEPSIPPISTEDLEATNFDQTLAELMKQMEGMSEDELQDDVHRRFEYHVCHPCQRLILANPLGKPRRVRAGTN